eukprot:c19076_g1_i2.p2 GENE.c19076_g1_i2~~c19076_g1_i2.p2  ORF type:complete len:134 (-),score=2.31 c19076_g1_i2:274-675(-)
MGRMIHTPHVSRSVQSFATNATTAAPLPQSRYMHFVRAGHTVDTKVCLCDWLTVCFGRRPARGDLRFDITVIEPHASEAGRPLVSSEPERRVMMGPGAFVNPRLPALRERRTRRMPAAERARAGASGRVLADQ